MAEQDKKLQLIIIYKKTNLGSESEILVGAKLEGEAEIRPLSSFSQEGIPSLADLQKEYHIKYETRQNHDHL